MHPLLVLLNLAAAVLLLLWAVRMVRTGMERAFGASLRESLRQAGGGLAGMTVVGMVMAVLLQSSTAVGVLAAGFVSSGMLSVAAGLAALVGADLGSALVVRVLALDLSALIPVFLLIGALLFLKSERRRVRQYGRITLGIGFILLSLSMIGQATEPLRAGDTLPVVIRYLQGDPLTAFVVVAVLTWAMHSSVAMVLLLAMLAQGGLLPMAAAVPMLLGANFGAGLIAVWLTRNLSVTARRVPVGNLILRGAMALAALAGHWALSSDLGWLGSRPEVQLVHAHVLFNAALVVFALPLIRAMERLLAALLPEPATPTETQRNRISALDPSVIDRPSLALASAKRELLAMGEAVIEMFTPLPDVLSDPSSERIDALRALGAEISTRHSEIKLYLAEVKRNDLSAEDERRSVELTDLAINLELACDIISRSLLPIAEEKRRRTLRFSAMGWSDILSLHARVRANMQLAMNVLVSADVSSARDLMREKERMRQLERESLDRHLQRLSDSNPDSVATSHMHVQAIRALKEINSLLVTVTHPILSEQGMILESRLAPINALRQ
ncbi:MAG: Na/Pi cotransporter family protein [Natronohydrobacter sp.]|nr:Na/Pi cotransporter family protein [Natronohydrobacter sp.]